MRVAVVGASGHLGRYVCSELENAGHGVLSTSRHGAMPVELATPGSLRTFLAGAEPDAVLHLAAIRRPEACELDPELAWRVNVLAPAEAAGWAAEHDRRVLSVSTDHVFGGDVGSYRETDEVDPLNTYAVTKFLGEREVLALGGTVVRCNFLGGGPGSLISSLIRRFASGEVVVGYEDAIISPLYAGDLARSLRLLVELPTEGLLHVGGDQPVSKYEIADTVRRMIGRGTLEPGSTPQAPLRRPLDTSLCPDLARSLVDVVDRGWEVAVRDSVEDAEKW